MIFAFSLLGWLTQTALAASTTRLVEQTGNDSGDCTVAPCLTIQYAIDQAVDGDLIVVGEGTFVESLVISAEITLQAQPATILSGRIDIQNSAVSLSNLTIDNGLAPHGGGIFAHNSTLTLTHVTIQNSQTTATNGRGGRGGGIYVENSRLTLLDSIVRDNRTASGDGIGLQPNGGDGGGIAVISSTLHIERSSINRNTTGAGATVSSTFGTMAGFGGFGGSGGGLYAFASDVTIVNSTISGNQTGDGGSTTLSRSGGNGAGVFLDGGATLTLLNVTIADNGTGSGAFDFSSGQGGGLSISAETTLTNTLIVANNERHNVDCRTTISHTVRLTTSIGCDGSNTTDALTTTIRPLDNELHDLQGGSPAIGAAANCPATDQRGVRRSAESCTIGAIEPPASATRLSTQFTTKTTPFFLLAILFATMMLLLPLVLYRQWRHKSHT